MIGIYKFTNKLTGESYIGQSSNISRRYKEHKSSSGEDTYFHRMLKHYGFWNFDFEVLEECNQEELDDKEVYYISKFKTKYPNGYNKDSGGKQPDKHTMRLASKKDVDKIIYMLQKTTLTNSEIAEKFDVTPQFISQINMGKSWVQDSIQYPIRDKVYQKNNRNTKQFFCKCCGEAVPKNNKTELCQKCYSREKSQHLPDKDTLYKLLLTNSFLAVGRMFNVSDNAVRKWCDKYSIPRDSKYYRSAVC